MNELLTIKEAYEKFKIHPSKIYKAVKKGNIQGNKRENTYLVIEKEVEEYFQSEISQRENSKGTKEPKNDLKSKTIPAISKDKKIDISKFIIDDKDGNVIAIDEEIRNSSRNHPIIVSIEEVWGFSNYIPTAVFEEEFYIDGFLAAKDMGFDDPLLALRQYCQPKNFDWFLIINNGSRFQYDTRIFIPEKEYFRLLIQRCFIFEKNYSNVPALEIFKSSVYEILADLRKGGYFEEIQSKEKLPKLLVLQDGENWKLNKLKLLEKVLSIS
jgi:hypothetical protein